MRVVSTDGDWNALAILDDAYRVTFPGTFDWNVTSEDPFTAYRASALYEGRIYALWVH